MTVMITYSVFYYTYNFSNSIQYSREFTYITFLKFLCMLNEKTIGYYVIQIALFLKPSICLSQLWAVNGNYRCKVRLARQFIHWFWENFATPEKDRPKLLGRQDVLYFVLVLLSQILSCSSTVSLFSFIIAVHMYKCLRQHSTRAWYSYFLQPYWI